MAAQSSFHVEIQNLKDALTASEKKAERYAQLIVTLSVELDDLRNKICHSCKTKLASGTNTVPSIAISANEPSSTDTATPQAHPTADNKLSIGPSRSLAASWNTNKSLPAPPDPEVVLNLSSPTSPHPDPNGDLISIGQQPEPPQWSVVYHPEVKQVLEFHFVRTITYDSRFHCIKMSHDGQRLAVGGNGETYLYKWETGSKICVFVDRYVKDSISIFTLQFSPNGRLLATGATDCQVRIWDTTMKRMRAMLKGHRSTIYNVAFSPNGRSLVSASSDSSARIWSVRDGSSKVLPVIGSPNIFLSVVFSPNGRYIAAGNYDKSLWLWDSRTHRLVAKWTGHTDCVWYAVFTPDGKGLMSGGFDKTVKYWDVSLLGNRQGLSRRMVEQGFPEVRCFVGHSHYVHSIALFPDNGRWIVTGSNDKSIRVWDTESGVCQLTLYAGQVSQVDVSRTQNLLATAGQDGHVTVWKFRLL